MKKTVLPNGFTILTKEIEHTQSVTMGYFMKAGSYSEQNYPAGMAHFMEHMFFKGTKTRSSYDIDEQMEEIGGYMNAYTDYEKTNYHCKVPFDQWKAGLDILSDMIWNATLDAKEVEKERMVILEEIKMYSDDPSEFVMDKFHEIFHKNQLERQSIIGTSETVSSIQREHLVNFMEEFYQPNNLVFSAAGKIKHEDVVAFFENYEFTRESKEIPVKAPFVHTSLGNQTVTFEKEIEQAHLVFGMQGPSRSDEDRYVMSVIAKILGGGSSSRLFRLIREERGLAYSVDTYFRAFSDSGYMRGYMGLEASKIEEAKKIVIEEVNRLKTELVPQKELNRVLSATRGSFMMGFESSSSISDYMGTSFINGTPSDPMEYVKHIEKVTPEDIMRVANKYFMDENWLFVQVVPK